MVAIHNWGIGRHGTSLVGGLWSCAENCLSADVVLDKNFYINYIKCSVFTSVFQIMTTNYENNILSCYLLEIVKATAANTVLSKQQNIFFFSTLLVFCMIYNSIVVFCMIYNRHDNASYSEVCYHICAMEWASSPYFPITFMKL